MSRTFRHKPHWRHMLHTICVQGRVYITGNQELARDRIYNGYDRRGTNYVCIGGVPEVVRGKAKRFYKRYQHIQERQHTYRETRCLIDEWYNE